MPEQTPGSTPAACQAGEAPAGLDLANLVSAEQLEGGSPTLAPGDRVRVRLAGDEDRVSGDYLIDDFGRLRVAALGPIDVRGVDLEQLRRQLTKAMIERGLVRPLANPVDVRLVESAGVPVAISGAVFDPGVVRVGDREGEARVTPRDPKLSGDANSARSLTTALRAAGGVRPDADLSQIYVMRGGRWARLDLTGAVEGRAFQDLTLTAGDKVVAPSAGCFRPALVRPSVVTAPGIRVYMSNLARPAVANGPAAVSRDATSLPYGARMLDGLIAMNCVGGASMNAGRVAVLVSRNPFSNQSIVVERAVERLVRNAGRDKENPYLMPGDGLACYDSRSMNARDAFDLLTASLAAAANVAITRNLTK